MTVFSNKYMSQRTEKLLLMVSLFMFLSLPANRKWLLCIYCHLVAVRRTYVSHCFSCSRRKGATEKKKAYE